VKLQGAAALAALSALAVPEVAFAHGLGGITDLPVPGWLFLAGGATVLVVSFVALGVLWKEPLLEGPGVSLEGLGITAAILLRVLRVVARAVSVVLFVVVWSAAAFGSERVILNLAPTFVYVVFWVGMAVTVVLVGNVWSVLDPWRGIADLVASAAGRLGVRRAPRVYPARAGVWPAVALLFAFILLELVYHDPSDPSVLAVAITIYSVATWTGMAVYGRDAWTNNGDGFALYFSLLSRLSLFGTEVRQGRSTDRTSKQPVPVRRVPVVRRPLSALTIAERRPGAVLLVAVMLGSVAFDGLSRSSWWQDRLFRAQGHFASEAAADRVSMVLNLAVLLLVIAIVAASYQFAVRGAQHVAGTNVDFRGVFLCSLLPIAFVYVLAHYLTFLIVQGQFALPLLSDPYGSGWDLLGTVGFQPRLDVLTPNQTWYIQVVALVLGHVAGLIVAHDRAVALVTSSRLAARTQLPMLGLMVFYTVGGMWLLSLT
jgi:hypothetical protein